MNKFEISERETLWEKTLQVDRNLGEKVSNIGFWSGIGLFTTGIGNTYVLPGETYIEIEGIIESGIYVAVDAMLPMSNVDIPSNLEQLILLSGMGIFAKTLLTDQINTPETKVAKSTIAALGMSNVVGAMNKLSYDLMYRSEELSQIAYDVASLGLGLLIMYGAYKFIKPPQEDISLEFE